MNRGAFRGLGRDRRIGSRLSAARGGGASGLGRGDLGHRRCRQLQRLQLLRRPRVVYCPFELPDVDPGERRDPVGAERLLDDDRAGRDHDQQRLDGRRRCERRELDHGVVVGDFWRDINTGAYGGSTLAQGQQWLNTGLEANSNINSQIYGIQIVCAPDNWSFGGCGYTNPPWVTVSGIELEGTENTAPFVTGEGALWTSGSYVRGIRPADERASGLEAPCCVDLGVDRGAERRGPSPARTIAPPLSVQTRAILRAMARGVFKLFTDASIQGSWRWSPHG